MFLGGAQNGSMCSCVTKSRILYVSIIQLARILAAVQNTGSSGSSIKIVVAVVIVVIVLFGLYEAGIFGGLGTSTKSTNTTSVGTSQNTSTVAHGTGDSIVINSASFSNGGLVLDIANTGGVATTALTIPNICSPDFNTCSEGSSGYANLAAVSPFNLAPGAQTNLNIGPNQWPNGLQLFAYLGTLSIPLQNSNVYYQVQVTFADGHTRMFNVSVPWTTSSFITSVSSAKVLLYSNGTGTFSVSLTLNDTSGVFVSGVTLYSGSESSAGNRSIYPSNDDFDLTSSCTTSNCPKTETLSQNFITAACCDPIITAGTWYMASVTIGVHSGSSSQTSTSQIAFWVQAQDG